MQATTTALNLDGTRAMTISKIRITTSRSISPTGGGGRGGSMIRSSKSNDMKQTRKNTEKHI
jgi:hypothetical protein